MTVNNPSGSVDTSALVVLAPATAARNVVQPTADVVPLTLKGIAAQAANLQEWQNSAGTALSRIQADGSLKFNGGAVLSDSGGSEALFSVDLKVNNRLRVGQSGGAGKRIEFGPNPDATIKSLDGNGLMTIYRTTTPTAPTMTGAGLILENLTAAPSTNPVGGGVIYCEAGALKYRGTAGTITTIGAA